MEIDAAMPFDQKSIYVLLFVFETLRPGLNIVFFLCRIELY